MKQIISWVSLVFIFIGFSQTTFAVPGMINFQGKLEVNGAPFSGTGFFRFAIVDDTGTTIFWANDDNEPPISEPTTDVQIDGIVNGLYNVVLGDSPQLSIPASVFDNDNIFLRIWFDDGQTGMQQLNPDQKVVSVGFSLKTQDANTLANLSSTQFLRSDQDDETSGSLFVNGNIGIGTSSPDARLHVNGDSLFSGFLFGSNLSEGYAQITSSGINIHNAEGTGGNPVRLGSAYFSPGLYRNGDLTLRTDSSGDIILITEGSGSVGIGTTNPSQTLWVRDTDNPSCIALQQGDNTEFRFAAHSSGAFTITPGSAGGNWNTFTITSDENVGIGTSNPMNKLHVAGNMQIGPSGGEGSIYGLDKLVGLNDLRFFADYTGTTELMRLTPQGNLGLGNTSPAGKLHIKTDATDYGIIRLQRASSTGEASIGYYGHTDNTNNWIAGVGSWGNTDDFVIGGGGSETVILLEQGTGDVGIGLTDPGYDLDVNGRIKATVEYVCPGADLAEKLNVHPDYQLTEEEIRTKLNDYEIDENEKHRIIANGEISLMEPGTVVVITEDGIVPCFKEDDTCLAGVISTKPALKMASDEKGQYIALAGKVPCKVIGPIKAGDILTTSSIDGYAQQTEEPNLGAVVGKALENFEGEKGVINIWIGGI